jgi:serine phosphatase RsbU (regulator of sigma subunit)
VSSEAGQGRSAPSWIDSRPGSGRARCGDFVECLDLGHRRAIIVGDVRGRNTAASHGAGALRAYARNLVKLGVPLATGLWLASSFFARAVATESVPFASLFLAIADRREGSMRYVSAGHEPGLLFDGDGGHLHLEATGPMLGRESILPAQQRVLPLRRNGLLVVVTDGITHAHPPGGDESSIFGSRGVVAAAQDALRQGADPAYAISTAALRHAGGQLVDDATVVVSSL